MAGLRLAAMGARADRNGRITDIAGDEPLVTDYLWDEVLGRQPPRPGCSCSAPASPSRCRATLPTH